MKFTKCFKQELFLYNKKEDVKYKYKIGDIVYSLWKGQLWKAIILDSSVKINPKGWHPIYYVGYISNQKKQNKKDYYYNNNYNEWKSEALIFEINEETKKKSMEIQKIIFNALKKDESFVENILNNLKIQEELNTTVLKYNKIEDEWFNYTKIVYSVLMNDKKQIDNGNLIILPKKPNIYQITNNYIKSINTRKRKRKTNITNNCVEQELEIEKVVISIIIEIFNKNLKRGLLYPIETHQIYYIERKIKDINYSEIYGVEHLLRLFTKLPEFLSNITYGKYKLNVESNLMKNDVDYFIVNNIKNNIITTVNSLMTYISNNISSLSINKYEGIKEN